MQCAGRDQGWQLEFLPALRGNAPTVLDRNAQPFKRDRELPERRGSRVLQTQRQHARRALRTAMDLVPATGVIAGAAYATANRIADVAPLVPRSQQVTVGPYLSHFGFRVGRAPVIRSGEFQ